MQWTRQRICRAHITQEGAFWLFLAKQLPVTYFSNWREKTTFETWLLSFPFNDLQFPQQFPLWKNPFWVLVPCVGDGGRKSETPPLRPPSSENTMQSRRPSVVRRVCGLLALCTCTNKHLHTLSRYSNGAQMAGYPNCRCKCWSGQADARRWLCSRYAYL